MRKLFKWFFRLTLAFVMLVVLLLVFKDAILKAIVQQRIRAATGMGVSIAKFRVGVLTPTIAVEDFRLYNAAEFGSSKFLDVPELYLEYDPAALLRRTVRIPALRLNMTELNIVRSGAGRTNLSSLPQSGPAAAAARGAGIKFGGIDTMSLTIGKVTYRDINHPKRDREYISNSKNQVFTNVQTVGDLYGVLTLLWLRSSNSVNGASPTGDRTGGSEGGASFLPPPANVHSQLEESPAVRKNRRQSYTAAWT